MSATVAQSESGGGDSLSAPSLSSQQPLSRSPSTSVSSSSALFVVKEFERCIREEPTIAIAVAGMQALTALVTRSQGQPPQHELRERRQQMAPLTAALTAAAMLCHCQPLR